MTSINITLELYKNIKISKEYIKWDVKVLEKLKISTCKHALVDSAVTNKDVDWHGIR